MKHITLSLAHYKAIQSEQGSAAAVEALRSYIEDYLKRPIELQFCGPNYEGDLVASLSFVRAAKLVKSSFGVVAPNLLTCGFDADKTLAISKLFDVLTTHSDLMPEPVKQDDETTEEPQNLEPILSGLVVGSFAKPDAFIRFEK